MVFTRVLVKTVTWAEIDIIKWNVQSGGVSPTPTLWKHAGLGPAGKEHAAPAGIMRMLSQEFKLFQMARDYYSFGS